jgi:hypothetical protein
MTDAILPERANETVAFNAEAYGEAFAAYGRNIKSAATTIDNANTAIGRETLTAMLRQGVTALVVATVAFDTFKPRKADGKLAEPKVKGTEVSVSALRGSVKHPNPAGDIARKNIDALFNIVAIYRSEADTAGANIVRPAVDSFIVGQGSAKSLRQLETLINEAMKAEAKRIAPAPANDTGDGEDTGDGNGDAKPLSLADMLRAVIAAYNEKPEQAASDEIASLVAELVALHNTAVDMLDSESEGEPQAAAA